MLARFVEERDCFRCIAHYFWNLTIKTTSHESLHAHAVISNLMSLDTQKPLHSTN